MNAMKKFLTFAALCLALAANATTTAWPYASDIVYEYMEGSVYTVQCGWFPKGVSSTNQTPLGVTSLTYGITKGSCTTSSYVFWYQRIGDTWEYLPSTSKPNPQANMFRAVNVYDNRPKSSPGDYDRYSACKSLYNIRMKRDQYFRSDVSSITFKGYPGQVCRQTITISYSSLKKNLSPAIVVQSSNVKTDYDNQPVYDGNTIGTPLYLGSASVTVTGTIPAQNGTGQIKFWDGSSKTLLTIPVNYVVEYQTQTVTWRSTQAKEVSVAATIPLNAVSSASQNQITYSIVSGGEYAQLTEDGKSLRGVLPGKVVVRATAPQANGYASAYADITIEVKSVKPTLIWGHVSSVETYYVGDIISVGGAYVSGGAPNPITYTVSKGEDVGYFVEPKKLLSIAAGVVTVRATVEAGNGYEEAWKEHDYEFFRRKQSISTDLSQIEIEAGDSMKIAAEASSQLPVTYSISEGNDLVYLRNDSLFAGQRAGNATLQIEQEGDVQYEPAEPVVVSITVLPKTATGTEQPSTALQIRQNGNLLLLQASQATEFRLYDAAGRLVAHECSTDYRIRLDAGVYLLYYQDTVRKIVVR